MSRVILTFLIVFYFCNSFAQDYQLKGKINGVDNGWAFVQHRQTGKIDSGMIQNGNFIISGILINPEFCAFGFSANGLKDYYLSFFLERGNLTMVANKDSLNDISISFTGSVVEKEFQQFQRQVSRINQLHYPKLKADAELEKLARLYALKNPKSYVSAFALISYENVPSKLSALYACLSPEIQLSYYGQLINNKISHP